MKKIVIHGRYNAEKEFEFYRLSGDATADINDFNLAMNVLRVHGHNPSDDVMIWDESNWNERVWG